MMMIRKLLVAATLLAAGVAAFADTETIGGITWRYTISSGKASVGGDGYSDDVQKSMNGAITIPAVLGGCPVTSIGDYAFYGCFGLTSVTIPSSVTSIGYAAFSDCSGLTSVTIPSGVTSIGNYALSGCSGLTSVSMSASMTGIGDGVFSGCVRLTSIAIPDGVISIGSGAFYSCRGLTSVTIPSSVTSIGENAFYDCSGLGDGVITIDGCVLTVNGSCPTEVSLPEGTRLIGGGAFYGRRNLTSVTMPESVISIGESAFYGCDELESVTIPSSVTNIGASAFYCCGELESMKIPEGVISIGESAFSGCSGLTMVTIPSSVSVIGDKSFAWCDGLTSFVVDVANPYYQPVDGLLLSKDGNTLVAGVKGIVTIPACVTNVANHAFSGRWRLTSVAIPSSVSNIGNWAFAYCSRLTSVEIPDGVTSVGEYAFSGCEELSSLTIPASVRNIGDFAFAHCSMLTAMAIPNGLTRINDGVFFDCNELMSLTLPSSVTSIVSGAFVGCQNLKDVTFEGAPPDGLVCTNTEYGVVYAALDQDVAIHYNAIYSDEWLSVIAAVGFTNAQPYEQEEKIVLPSWGSDFVAAKELADRKHMPLVVVWSNQGCSYCERLRNMFDDSAMMNWLTNRCYITVDSVGDAEVKQFSRNSTRQFPYVAVYLNEEGTTTNKITFTGRNDMMPVHSGSLMDQFTNSVDRAVAVMRGTGSFPIQRSVTFDANGGECTVGIKLTDDGYSLVTLPAATRFGYEFVGWYTDAVAGERIDGSETISADVTYYAHWEVVSTIVWQYDLRDDYAEIYGCLLPLDFDGRLVFPAEIEGRSRIVIASESFVGDMNIKTVELSAAVSQGSYPLGWVLFCGCTNLEAFVVSDENPDFVSFNGAVYSKDGRTLVACPRGAKTFIIPAGVTNIATGAFAGCCCLERLTIGKDVVSVDADALADCEALADIYFYCEPPENWMTLAESAPCVVHYNDAFGAEWKCAIEGFEIDAQPFDEVLDQISVVGNVRVSFIAPNGVASVTSATFATNGVYGLLPAARRDGFTFAGWYTAVDGMTRVSEFSQVDPMVKTLFARWIEDDVTLYAQWGANAYTVMFNPNGGSGDMSQQKFLYDQSQSISATKYVRTGYTFKGWSTTENGDVVYKDSECVSNLTAVAGFAVALFAQWEKDIELDAEDVEDWLIDDLAPEFAAKNGESESSYRKRFKEKFGSDYSAAFYKETGKVGQDGSKLLVWHDYVAGTDPLDLTSQFKASITFDENCTPIVKWTPDLNDGGKQSLRKYTTFGCENLGGVWRDMSTVPEADMPNYRFFKVMVEIP